jgi:hypothetical protein
MKSKALSVVRLPDRYKKDLPAIEGMSAEQLTVVANWLAAIEARPNPEQTEDDLFELATLTGLPAERLYPAINTLRYTRDLLSRYGDSAEAVLADLVELQFISPAAAERLKGAVAHVPPPPARAWDYWRAYGLVLPVYEYALSRCLLMPIFEESPAADPEAYKPHIQAVVPAVVLDIAVNAAGTATDERDQISFVIGESALDELVTRLLLAKKELNVFRNHLKV